MAKINSLRVKQTQTQLEKLGKEGDTLTVRFQKNPDWEVGDRVVILSSDGAEFIGEITDIEEERGQAYFELV